MLLVIALVFVMLILLWVLRKHGPMKKVANKIYYKIYYFIFWNTTMRYVMESYINLTLTSI
jgi:hypothetical protein